MHHFVIDILFWFSLQKDLQAKSTSPKIPVTVFRLVYISIQFNVNIQLVSMYLFCIIFLHKWVTCLTFSTKTLRT